MDLELAGKVVIVTGGSRSLGAATVEHLVSEGAHVITCARDRDRLEAHCASLRGPGTALGIPADVSRPADLERLFAQAGERYGRLDGLVNNAGGGAAAPFQSLTDQAWEQDLQLKVLAAVRTVRLAFPLLRAAGGGSVVNVLATAAKAPAAGSMPSSVSRAAGLALTKALAHELGPDGIRINAVLVGIIESDSHAARAERSGLTPAAFYEQQVARRRIPLGRVGTGTEFADTVSFLLSPRSSYLTGTGINVDGGASPAP